MVYFKQEDILHILVAAGPEAQSVELAPDITLEMNTDGQTLGVEIVNASQHVMELLAQRARQLPTSSPVVVEYWLHEGPDDATSDEELLAEALETLRSYKRDKSGWKTLDDFELELTQE